jgi:hypothetical protein
MTVRLSISMNVGPNDGATRSSERANMKFVLERIIQEIGGGTSVGNASVLDVSGNAVASFTYSPTASS